MEYIPDDTIRRAVWHSVFTGPVIALGLSPHFFYFLFLGAAFGGGFGLILIVVLVFQYISSAVSAFLLSFVLRYWLKRGGRRWVGFWLVGASFGSLVLAIVLIGQEIVEPSGYFLDLTILSVIFGMPVGGSCAVAFWMILRREFPQYFDAEGKPFSQDSTRVYVRTCLLNLATGALYFIAI